MIVYAVAAEVSILKMFVAGVLPGIILIALFSGCIAVWALLNPGKTPAQVERLALLERLRRALLQLREDKRELIVLTRFRGMSHQQIAELLGVETGAIKVRIHRALKELRDIFLTLSDGDPSCDVKRSTRTLQII